MRRTLLFVIAVPIGLVLAYTAAMVLLHTRFIYPFRPDIFNDPAFHTQSISVPGAEPLEIQIAHGAQDAPVVLFFMGNVGALAFFKSMLTDHLSAGRTVIAMPYRGGGGVVGRSSETSLKRDALAVADYAVSKFPDRALFLHGYSLGTGLAVHVAAHRQGGDGLILSAPYDAMCRLMAKAARLPACYLPVQRWRTDKDLAGIDVPVLILHGMQDRLIPLSHGKRLAELMREQGLDVTFAQIEGAGHGDLPAYALHHTSIDQFFDGLSE